jgi:hypothetical protein
VCLNTSTKMSSSTYALLFRNREGPSPWLTPRNIANMSRLCMAVSVECRSASVYGLWKLDGCCVPSQIPISLSIPPPPLHSFTLFITYIVSRIDRYSSAYYFVISCATRPRPETIGSFFRQLNLFAQPILQLPGNMRLRVFSVYRGVGSI